MFGRSSPKNPVLGGLLWFLYWEILAFATLYPKAVNSFSVSPNKLLNVQPKKSFLSITQPSPDSQKTGGNRVPASPGPLSTDARPCQACILRLHGY